MKRILLLAALCLFAVPAKATLYYANLNTVPTVGSLNGPCYCGNGPVFQVTGFHSGDIVNFGTVQIFSVFDDHDWAYSPYYLHPDLYTPEMIAQMERLANYQSGISTNTNPLGFPQPQRYQDQFAYPAPLGSSVTFELEFAVGEFFQFGWTGPFIYTPPSYVGAVPEPSTWAMLLLGFAGIGFMALNRKRAVARSFIQHDLA